MRFRKIAPALLACLALGAFAANAAEAAEGDGWTIGTTENQTSGGTLISSGTYEEVACIRHVGSSLVFASKLLGSSVKLTSEEVDCLEIPEGLFESRIDNTVSKGHTEVTFTFTGVKVVEPSNCSVGGAAHELTTRELTGQIIMDPSNKTTGPIYDKFSPEKAETGFITIEFAGALCPLAEDTGTLKGTTCGESVNNNLSAPNKTGTLTKVQTLLFGSAQQTTGGCALTFNGAAAQLSGAIDNELVDFFTHGKPFGAD
jgi:hypothetical protein